MAKAWNLGYGKKERDWVSTQPSPKVGASLGESCYGCSSQTKWEWGGEDGSSPNNTRGPSAVLRYSRAPWKHGPCGGSGAETHRGEPTGAAHSDARGWNNRLGGVWSQGWNLKELTEGHHQEWSLRLNLIQHGKTYQGKKLRWLTAWQCFLDPVASGAWPFLVRGVICQVNSLNERDLNLLNRGALFQSYSFLEGLRCF